MAVEVAVVKHRSRMLVTVAVVMSFCCFNGACDPFVFCVRCVCGNVVVWVENRWVRCTSTGRKRLVHTGGRRRSVGFVDCCVRCWEGLCGPNVDESSHRFANRTHIRV